MLPKTTSNDLENLIVTRHTQGLSIRTLARQFGLGRNTIRRILRQNQKERQEDHDPLTRRQKRLGRPGKLAPYLPLMIQLLNQYPRITGER